MKQIRYIIADDHKIFREGLKMVLEDDEQIKLTGEASNGLELMELLQQKKPDIILLDIKMPGMDGFEATRNIRLKYPKIKILILTMYDEPHFILHMVQAGANGYLLKNAEADEIKVAIRAVYESGNYFNDMVSKTMLRTIARTDKTGMEFKSNIQLSEKEVRMLQLICQELTTAEIADELSISSRTAEGLRASLLDKIGVRNTAGLVLYAIKTGLVS